MDDPTTNKVWAVGDKCLALYSGDNQYYKAVVRRIRKDNNGCIQAEVQFKGYTVDENEIVELANLKEISKSSKQGQSPKKHGSELPQSGFQSPLLNYMSEEDRIRAQYADMYDDPRPRTTAASSGKNSSNSQRSKVRIAAKKRKGAVAIGGDIKESPKIPRESKAEICRADSQLPSTSDEPTPVILDDVDLFGMEEGFSANDIERPYFPGKSDVGPKEPLLLSEQDEVPVVQVPGTINRYLRDYQREGIQFLYRHYKTDSGAILGDDMGLGKTIQVISLICGILGKTGGKEDCQRRLPEFLQKESPQKSSSTNKVFLIICPNSVLYNWLDEFETWTHCTIGMYHGKERDETLRKAKKGKLDAVITTYETFRLYFDDLATVSWSAAFVDEVHKIKEPSALITQALKSIHTRRRYGLTGTAVQNKMGELWCLLDWANPGCLGTWNEFRMEYEQVITTGQKYNASKRELADARHVARRFAKQRDQWLLRRTKTLIADQLPTKDENVVFCNLSSLQVDVYRALVDSQDVELVLRQKEPCDCSSGVKRGRCCYKRNDRGESIKSLTFSLMSLLIKVANHTALLMPDINMSKKQRQKAQHYCDIAFAKQPQYVELSREARFATLSDPSYCGKMQVLEKLLTLFKRDNHKVLLFSCYTQLLDILEMYMKTTHYVYRRLDGKTPVQDRQKFVREFNKDPDIFLFLISTKAGGLGLNLTGANVVIIFDPNWNPTYDLQAQDRAYRIGQHRDVRVYRLISRGSIEENMYLRQLYKQQLASVAVTTENAKRYFTAVAGDKDQQGEVFGLHNLFALREDGSCLTEDVIQREKKTELGISMAKYKPQISVEDNEKEPLAELLSDDGEGVGDDDGDGDGIDDIHGLASQLEEIIDDLEDGEKEDDEDDPQKEMTLLSSGDEAVKRDDADDDDDNDDGDGDGDGGGSKEKRSQWRTDLRRMMRGKAILGKGGQPKLRIKGCKRLQNDENGGHCGNRVNDAGYVNDPSHLKVCTNKNGNDDETNGRNDVRDADRDVKVLKKELGGRGKKEESKKAADQIQTRKKNGRSGLETAEDVFKECGVTYIHSNQKVVGSSRVEDHVSEIALRDVFEVGQFSQEPAYCQVPTLEMESLESQVDNKPKKRKSVSTKGNQSQSAVHKVGETTVLIGQTPVGIKKTHFPDMSTTLEFSSPAALAKHIQTLPDEECLKLIHTFYSKKHPGLDFEKFITLPTKPEEDSSLETDSKKKLSSSRRGSVNRESGTRFSGQRNKAASRKKADQKAESDWSDWEMERDEDDDRRGERRTTGRSEAKEERTIAINQRQKNSNKARRGNKRRVDYSRNEIYQEIYDEEDEVDVKFGMLFAKKVKETKAPSRNKIEASSVTSNDVSNSTSVVENREKSGSVDLKITLGDGEITGNKMIQDQGLSFLDEIFLSGASKSSRKPPPKKQTVRHNNDITMTTMDSESMTEMGSCTSDDTSDALSRVRFVKQKYHGDDATEGSTVLTRFRGSCDVNSKLDSDESLWKRNIAFVPCQTYFDREDSNSDDSESLFVVNTKYKGGILDNG